MERCHGRISAKRLLPVVTPAGYTGSGRNLRRVVAEIAGYPAGHRVLTGRVVYHRCMGRTNIDIDELACGVVMKRYQLPTKRDAVNFALRTVAGESLGLDRARRLRGSGWSGNLEEMRGGLEDAPGDRAG